MTSTVLIASSTLSLLFVLLINVISRIDWLNELKYVGILTSLLNWTVKTPTLSILDIRAISS